MPQDSPVNEPLEKLDDIRERIDLEPFNADLHQLLGKALLKAGDLDSARLAYERAIVLDPADPWSHLYLGNLHYWKSEFVEALEEFQNAQQLAPDLAMPYICIADAHANLGDFALADKFYHKAVQVEPDDPDAKKNLRRWRKIKRGITKG
jgi:Flp pilus assembly protein TadD